MSSNFVLLAKLPLGTSANCDKFAEMFAEVAKYSRENEPGLLKYCITRPRDEPDSTTLWAIEEYTDQATFDEHMKIPGVVKMVEFLTANPTISPVLYSMYPVCGFTRTDPVPLDPMILVASLFYEPGKREEALQRWPGVTAAAKDEPGTLVHGILKDKDDENLTRTLEVYESEKYLKDVHAQSSAVLENREKDKAIRKSQEYLALKAIAGFFRPS